MDMLHFYKKKKMVWQFFQNLLQNLQKLTKISKIQKFTKSQKNENLARFLT